MKFVNNETSKEIKFSIFDEEYILSLLLANKTICQDNHYYKLRQDQEVFETINNELIIELIETAPEELDYEEF